MFIKEIIEGGTYINNDINTFSTMKQVPSGYFAYCSIQGETLNLPQVTKINDYAFKYTVVSSIYAPNCTSIVGSQFSFANIQNIDFSNLPIAPFYGFYNCAIEQIITNASVVESHAFDNCVHLSSFIGHLNEISAYAFYNCQQLRNIDLINVYSIGNSAFEYCAFSSLSLFGLSTIGVSVFYGCSSLSMFSYFGAGNANRFHLLGTGMFQQCSSLYSISASRASFVSQSCFCYCKSLTNIYMPLVSWIGSYAFYTTGLTNITSTTLSSCLAVSYYAFAYCSKITGISMYSLSSIGQRAFEGCTSLTTARVSRCLYIGSYAFYSCSKLSSIYINTNVSSQICTLANSNAFLGTLITSSTGRIVVPNALRASYKAAANWAYFSNRIYSN